MIRTAQWGTPCIDAIARPKAGALRRAPHTQLRAVTSLSGPHTGTFGDQPTPFGTCHDVASNPQVDVPCVAHTLSHPFYLSEGLGYHHQARSVAACVQAEQHPFATIMWTMSQRILRTTEHQRAQWGLRYAGEQGIF